MASARTILIAAILCGLFAGSVRAQQTLRWGADPSGGAPYVYTDPANPDNYIGYEKEMVDALAAAMGRRAEFVPSDWETLVSALQRNSFDVIVNGLEPTGDRARQHTQRSSGHAMRPESPGASIAIPMHSCRASGNGSSPSAS